MIPGEEPVSEYAHILKDYLQKRDKADLIHLLQFGSKFVEEDIGPERILAIHLEVVRDMMKELPTIWRPPLVATTFECLSKSLTSYSVASKQAHQAVQAAEEKLQRIFESVTEGITVTDLNGVIIAASGRILEIHGVGSKDEILGKSALEFIAQHDHQRAMLNIQKALEEGSVRNIEYSLLKTDGSQFPGELSTSVLKDPSGNPVGFIAITRDITERKQAEEVKKYIEQLEQEKVRLQEVDRLKSVFLASVGHELRTPLNSIIGFTSRVLQGMAGEVNEEQRKQLSIVKNSTSNLLSLINDILDISKIEAGKTELSLEEFSLNDVVGEVVETLSPTVSEKGLELLTEVPEGIILFSDRRRVKQVLMNLASNAVEFTDQGSVKIAARVPGDGNLEIRVIDTGIGIRKEDMDKLFQPFQQIYVSPTKKYEGTGLGLYLCKKLTDLLGGDISVRSEYGRRSEFTITMPLQYKGKQGNKESAGG